MAFSDQIKYSIKRIRLQTNGCIHRNGRLPGQRINGNNRPELRERFDDPLQQTGLLFHGDQGFDHPFAQVVRRFDLEKIDVEHPTPLKLPDSLVHQRSLTHPAFSLKHHVLSRLNKTGQLLQKMMPWTEVPGADDASVLERIHRISIVMPIGITPYSTMST